MRAFFRILSNFVVFFLVLFLMATLSLANLLFTNAFGETCGIFHPYIFQVEVSSINIQTGSKALAISDPSIPFVANDETLDTYLRVYDSDYQLLAENDDFEGRNSLIENFPIGQVGSITIEVATYGDLGTGYYRLSLEESSRVLSVSDEFAIRIDGSSFDTPQTLTGNLETGARRSYQISALQDISITLNGENDLDTYLRVYDVQGNILAENDDYNRLSSAILSFPAQDYETIIVEVATFGDASAGNFELIFAPANFGFLSSSSSNENTGFLRYGDGGNLTIGQSSEGLIRSTERISYTVSSDDERESVTIRLVHNKREGFFGLPTRLFGDSFTALGWASCVEYYGYVASDGFQLSQAGYSRYGQGLGCEIGTEGCDVLSRIKLTLFGQILLYVFTPGLVILLPIAAVYSVRSTRHRPSAWRSFQWIMMLSLVALHVLTTSLLYVHLSTVSNIEALANFAYGILAGAATGSAIAFMDRVLDVFGGRDEA